MPKLKPRCCCPSCFEKDNSVCSSWQIPATGEIVRRRSCELCGHRWYTAQEPEYIVHKDRVRFRRLPNNNSVVSELLP